MTTPGRAGRARPTTPSRDVVSTVPDARDTTDEPRYQVMPPLSAEEYEALRANIAERGVLVPVLVDQHGHVLDGHHRRAIAGELGLECPVEVRQVDDDEQARDVAIALNLARRHLTREQKRDLIAAEIERRPDDSDRAIGRRLGCDHKTVGSVRGGEVPHPETLEALADSLMAAATEQEFEDAIEQAKVEGDLSRENVERIITEGTTYQPTDLPVRTVTGRDGKTYPKAQPAQRRRRPLPEYARDVGWDLRKLADRIERVFADDRYDKNAEAIGLHLRGSLDHMAQVCQAALARLEAGDGGEH